MRDKLFTYVNVSPWTIAGGPSVEVWYWCHRNVRDGIVSCKVLEGPLERTSGSRFWLDLTVGR